MERFLRCLNRAEQPSREVPVLFGNLLDCLLGFLFEPPAFRPCLIFLSKHDIKFLADRPRFSNSEVFFEKRLLVFCKMPSLRIEKQSVEPHLSEPAIQFQKIFRHIIQVFHANPPNGKSPDLRDFLCEHECAVIMVEVRGVEPLSKSVPMQTVTSIPPRLEQSPKDEQADKNPFGCASETCFQISMRRRIRKGEAMQSYFKKGFLQVSLPSRFIYFTTRQFGVCRREARSSRECVIFVSSI